MKKISVIYWSGTGNTEQMAEGVAKGAAGANADVRTIPVGLATIDDVLTADAVALGCPSMGDEVLEESVMEPFIKSIEKADLTGKPLVLFGSYDWGDGKWMDDWNERMKTKQVNLVQEGLIIRNTPDEPGLIKCQELGKKLVEAVI